MVSNWRRATMSMSDQTEHRLVWLAVIVGVIVLLFSVLTAPVWGQVTSLPRVNADAIEYLRQEVGETRRDIREIERRQARIDVIQVQVEDIQRRMTNIEAAQQWNVYTTIAALGGLVVNLAVLLVRTRPSRYGKGAHESHP